MLSFPAGTHAVRKVVGSVATALALIAAIAPACLAQDSERVRYYLHLRGQDSNPATGVHDAWGLSLGANLGRYWGLELSGDIFERRVKLGGQTLGEYGIGAVVPQLRLRYPFLDDRLVPYVVGGIGIGLTEFNDRKAPGFGVSVVDNSSVFPIGTVGAGIEYYFADNLALGIEFKYLLAPEQTVTIGGVRQSQRVDSLMTTVGLRLLIPELRPQPLPGPSDVAPTRLYAALRYGGTLTTNTIGYPGIEVDPEPGAFFGAATHFFGASVGLNFGRYLGVELSGDGYEARLDINGVSIKEVGVGHFMPYLRLRYPLWEGRVVPYLLAGAGFSTVKTNDTKPPGADVEVDIEQFGPAAGIGGGVEYFVASNIAVGVEARYLTARGHTIRINNGPKLDGHIDTVAIALSLRVFLASFGR